jgi:hypothetical protein
MVKYSNGIAVVGNISVQQGLVDGAVVHTIVDGRRLDIHMVDKHGKYKIDLAYNHRYELIFAQRGNYPQKIVVETLVPETVIQSNPQYRAFSLDIHLFTEIPGINVSFVENPIRKIYYNPNLDNFITDVYYNDTQIAEYIKQTVFHSQIISKETDFLTKLTRIELAEMKREYNKILDRAGKIYDKGPVLAALDGYMSSKKRFKLEKFPNFRNNEINDLLGSILITAELDKEHSEKFDVFINEADNFLNEKKYTSARISCNRALSIKPDDVYANMQSDIINDFMEKQAESERYENLIAHADNSVNELLYSIAAKDYQCALLIKPDEQYPKIRLEEVNKVLEKEIIDAAKKKSYNQAMKEGEAMFQKQFYEKSLSSFVVSSNLESENNQANGKIEEVKQLMTKLADQLMYDKLIAIANKSYKKEQYHDALNDYYAAVDIIPDDRYAATQINIINQKLELDEKFADFIANANHQFTAKEYIDSRKNYLQALKINTKDKYSKNRIKEIDMILAEQNINETILKTDNHFNERKSEMDPDQYLSAQILAPGESYNQQINEVENDAGLENIYYQFMNRADELYNEKNYVDSRRWYYKAWDVKPGENNPKQRIDHINDLLKAISTSPQEKEYQRFVDLADSTFRNNQYALARGWYNRALSVKANEDYPKEQLKEIEIKITERMAEQSGQQFETAVQKASVAFKEKNYNVARFWYKKALELRPDDDAVKKRLYEIQNVQ